VLGFLIPDPLQRSFVGMVAGLPLAVQGIVFTFLCAVFVLILSRVLRLALLYADCELASSFRQKNTDPPKSVFALGWIALGQWWLMLGLCAVLLLTGAIFESSRSGLLPNSAENGAVAFARDTYACLRPGSGRGRDSLAACRR